MQLTLDIDITGAKVWRFSSVHRESKHFNHFRVERLFSSLDKARTAMLREVNRVGLNMFELWQTKLKNQVSYAFVIDEEQYECEARVFMDGKVVDRYVGRLYCDTIM